MSLLVSLIIVAVLISSGFFGTKRGFVLIGLEIISFTIATILVMTVYHQMGTLIKSIAHVTIPLSNVAGVIIVWVVAEVAGAIFIRFAFVPRLTPHVQLSNINRIGGSVLNVFKSAAIITLGLAIYIGLPITTDIKRPVSNSFVAQQLLASSGDLPAKIALGLGRDINDSLSFFTITSDPESEKRVDLGYTTTNITIDAKDEAAMLVLLNHERTSRNLPALTLNVKARAVARTYAADLFARGYFSHISNEGKTPFDRMKAGGVSFGSAGENLALAPTLQLAHTGLMNSPGHRDNILSPNYSTVGIGIIDGGPYGLMVAQDFTD